MVNLSELVHGDLSGCPLIAWTTVLLISAFVGFVSNFVIIWIVCTDKTMQTTTNFYIANLALADGLVTTICAPVMSIRLNNGDWPFGYKLCRFNEFFGALNVCVSLFSLAIISISQYNFITQRQPNLTSNVKAVLMICCIWLVSALISVPHWLPVATHKYIATDGYEKSICIRIWSDYTLHFIYRVTAMIFAYFVPLISITYCYCRIGVQVWQKKNTFVNKSESQINQNRNDKKIIIGMLLIVIGFAVSWLPAHIFLIVTAYDVKWPVGEFGYTTVLSLVIVHSMYNPLVYYCTSSRWRAAFKKVLRCC